ADGLGWLAHRVDKRHRLVAADNVRHAFPDYSEPQVARLVRRCYRHFARVAVEMILLPRKFRFHLYPTYAACVHGGPVARLLTGRGPVLLVTGHLGNWEMVGYVLGA